MESKSTPSLLHSLTHCMPLKGALSERGSGGRGAKLPVMLLAGCITVPNQNLQAAPRACSLLSLTHTHTHRPDSLCTCWLSRLKKTNLTRKPFKYGQHLEEKILNLFQDLVRSLQFGELKSTKHVSANTFSHLQSPTLNSSFRKCIFLYTHAIHM